MGDTLRHGLAEAFDSGFPRGGGELGALIRAHDWSATALGPIAAWPLSLRTAVDIMLHSPLPMVVLWGAEGVMLYNDPYAEIAGGRHPRLLGCKVLEGWPEVADFNAHVLDVVLAGGTLSFRDQEMSLNRTGVPEQVWFDLHYGPIPDETGRAAGVLATVSETSQRVRPALREAFLFNLGDHLRQLSEVDRIVPDALRRLGEYMGVDTARWTDVDASADHARIVGEWAAAPAADPAADDSLAWASADITGALKAGEVVAISGVEAEPPALLGELHRIVGPTVQAAIIAPVIRAGQWRAALSVHSREPRVWRDEERELVRDVAGRTWAARRRVRAEHRLRESETRFRALVNATSDVIYRMNADWSYVHRLDGGGMVADTEGAAAAWMDEMLFPEDRPQVEQAIRDAVAARRPFELEHRIRQPDGASGWNLTRAVPLLGAEGEVVEWFGAASDVTGRKQAEEHLQLVVNELNHRVKNNLAMTLAIAAQTFRNGDDMAQTRTDFEARILALAQANDLLTGERWVGASLRGVIAQALEPYAADRSDRLDIEGPELELSPKTALSVSLAFHELATNASKYGAWSVVGGRVDVDWSVASTEKGDRLRLRWRESGGPLVFPPKRRGFGSRLIERGLAAEMDGTVRLDFRPEGLACQIDAPLRTHPDRADAEV